MSAGLTATAKTSYIPSYLTSVQFIQNGDTVTTESCGIKQEVTSQDGKVSIYVQHEDVTTEKVKAIKRAKSVAGWASVSAGLSAFKMVTSAGSARFTSNLINARVAADLAYYAKINAMSEQVLEIGLWVDNNSDEEIMVNDMERGLTWFILPHQSLQLPVQNPDAARLRISNATTEKQAVKYVNVAVASMAEKKEIDYEDDEVWVTNGIITRELNGQTYQKHEYAVINKRTFERQTMKKNEYEEYLKKLKSN